MTELIRLDRPMPLQCVICEFDGVGTQVAEVNALGRTGIEVVRCPVCGSLRMSGEAGDVTPDDASVDAYIEAGAGIDTIAHCLDVPAPPSARLLDVGCNYGFGLDLARRLLGWEVVGVEPSLAGRRGAAELGLDIRAEYLTPDTELEGRFDVVMASEVLEHVPDPRAFVALLAGRLTPDGILVLTTPAAEVVDPATPDENVLIALSPGFHVFLASAPGLEQILRGAGFGSVSVLRDGGTLRARACLLPGVDLTAPATARVDRLALERYYDERADRAPSGSALANGMATRHLRSAVNRGAWDVVEASAPRAVAALATRHGFDLAHPEDVTEALRGGAVPAWNLVGAAYALGMLEMLGRSRPDRAVAYFDVTLAAIAAWRRYAGLLDGESADLQVHALEHRAIALARFDPDAACAALEEAASRLTPTVASTLRLRVFVELVSAGATARAGSLVPDVADAAPSAARSQDVPTRRAGRDALYCLSTWSVATGDLDGAERWARALEGALDLGDDVDDEERAAVERLRTAGQEVLAHVRDAREAQARGEGEGETAVEPVPVAPAHGLEQYWVDAAGTYVAGWAHAGADPVLSIALRRGGRSVEQEPTDRPDLAAFWPGTPQVARAGFALHLPGRPDAPLELVVRTESSVRRLRLDVPDGPLPGPGPLADVPARRPLREALTQALAAAPAGPVLAIGLRGHDSSQVADLVDLVGGEREVVVADVHPGPGVDVVADAHDLAGSLGTERFAVVYSEMLLEHVAAPWLVAAEVNRVLVPGGLSAHAAPMAWPEHAQPNDFWRFTSTGLAELFGPRTGFEILTHGPDGEVRIHPVGEWGAAHRAMPTLATPSVSWVLSRKAARLPDGAVAWPYDVVEGMALARQYPVDALTPDHAATAAGRAVVDNGVDAPPRATVSVVMALYQGARYVTGAIESIAAQTRLPDELVVVDDGSTDGGLDLVEDLDLPFDLVVVRQPNQGQSAARNTGIRHARGDFVAFCDQDDTWRRNHLASLVPLLEADPEIGWVYSDFDEVDDEGRMLTHAYLREVRVPNPKASMAACVGADLMVLPSASVLRRDAVLQVGGFDVRLCGYEDDDLFVRMFARGWRHAFLPESTIRYRVHAGGASAGPVFLRSRMIYIEKLRQSLPVDHRRNRDLINDVVLPRFHVTTLDEYAQAIAMREYPRALELAAALRTIAALQGRRGLRPRVGLWLAAHPRRFRSLLLRLATAPRWLRPHFTPVLDLRVRTVVREELRTGGHRHRS